MVVLVTPYAWTNDDADAFVAFCATLGITDRTIPLRVWSNESDNSPCPPRNGPAVGICQFEPATLRGLGYEMAADPKLDAFCAMTVAEQLLWAARFFSGATGRLNSVAAFYLWDFLPAQLHLADTPDAVVCGSRVGDPYSTAYHDNRGFDATRKGWITPQDLTDAANRQYGPRAQAIAALVAQRADTSPELLTPSVAAVEAIEGIVT